MPDPPTTPVNLHALALDAIEQIDFTKPSASWSKEMEKIIARAHTAAFAAATEERTGVRVRGLIRAERNDLKRLVGEQVDYLKGFVSASAGLSEAQVKARAELYAGAVRKTYYQTRWGDWMIPDRLLPGNQQCVTNCRCSIRVADHDDGTGTLTRTMGATEHHCTECPPLAGDYGVKRIAA